jgi:hypothetical protein
MRSLIAVGLLVLTGCECGPAVSCKVDDDCGGWGRCVVSGGKGYCVQQQQTDSGEVGPPRAAMSEAPLDLGLAPCGRAPVTKSVTLTNEGGGSLTFSASTGTQGAFSVSPGEGTLLAGESATFVVAASAPATATAGAESLGQLVVTTSDAAHARFEVPLSMRAAGVTLTLTPGVASFGVGPLNAPAPTIPLTLTNAGNVAATVTLAQPTDSQFSLTWSGSPSSISLAPGATADALTAGFTPTKTTPSSSPATVSVAEAVCGASVVSIPMTGQGTNGSVGLSTTDVFFGTGGRVNCGTKSPDRTLKLRNTGNQSYAWTATLGKGTSSPFTVAPSSGTVPANGGEVTLTISTTAIPAEAPTADEAFGDTLFVATDVANDTSHPIALHQTANGARLSFAPPAVDFGLVRVGTAATAGFSVVNDGNVAAHLGLSTVNPKFTLPSGMTTAPGGVSTLLQAEYAPGNTAGTDTATATVMLDAADVLCAPLPAGLGLSGVGTSGSVSYAPASLDFGSVNCGATASAKTVTFKNDGNQAYTVAIALGGGTSSPYTVAMNPVSGMAATDGGTVVVTVTPKQIPQTSPVTPNFFGDTLTVTTDVNGDTPHDIPLRQTARGAIFQISSTSLAFGSIPVGVSASAQFSATNNGNAAGTLTFAPQNAVFTLPATATVGPGASSVLTGQFAPTSATVYSDTAALGTSSTVLCAPLPSTTMSLSGTGTGASVVGLSPANLSFGQVDCGTTAAAKTVGVTNLSSQTLSLALSLVGGASAPYTVSGPAAMDAGTTVTVTVTPKPVPSQLPDGGAVSTSTGAFDGTLQIRATGGPVDETRTVPLTETAHGAVLSFNPTSLSFNASFGATSASKPFTVNNTGNYPAPYTLAKGGTDAADFNVSPLTGNAAAGVPGNHTASFTAPVINFSSRSATVSVSTGVPTCAPLPRALQLTGAP